MQCPFKDIHTLSTPIEVLQGDAYSFLSYGGADEIRLQVKHDRLQLL